MKRIVIKFTSLLLAAVFLSHVTGIRISEHQCFDCGTNHIEVGGHFHALHLIISLNKHNPCCDPFHDQHKNHSQSCSNKFLVFSIPFKTMEPSKIHNFNPATSSLQEITLFLNTPERGHANPTFSNRPEQANILLKTCQFRT